MRAPRIKISEASTCYELLIRRSSGVFLFSDAQFTLADYPVLLISPPLGEITLRAALQAG